MAGAAAAGIVPAGGLAAAGAVITPEAFGARGDGRTNDTDAFAALSAHVNAVGGGTIALRPVTYLVGKQFRSRGRTSEFAFIPSDILHFVGCSANLVIRGNGATLRCAPRLRYGAFDRTSGTPLPEGRTNLDIDKRASPYFAMIDVEDCTGSVDISGIELDGNLRALRLGGKYGKGGWQAPGSGIRMNRNKGPARLSRIHSHHHPFDGLLLTDSPGRTGSTIVSDSVLEFNARQGCSITSGRNYVFERCAFRHIGRAGMRSSPAAGVDIEAEASTIRNVTFSNCEFSDNAGFGMVAGSGDSEGLAFDGCTFVGTTNFAAWPDKPLMRFSNCLFVGAITHTHGDPDPRRAVQFLDCAFTDDPGLSPTGEVFVPPSPSSIAVIPNMGNVLFNRCRFTLTGRALLPYSTDAIFADCEMSQRSPARSSPHGTYLGMTTITGNADLGRSRIRGSVILNGRPLPRTA